MKYEVEAQHDFGDYPKSGMLSVYIKKLDDKELLLSIVEDLLEFPSPLTITIRARAVRKQK